jgi:hypothetical protein
LDDFLNLKRKELEKIVKRNTNWIVQFVKIQMLKKWIVLMVCVKIV